MNDLQIFSNEEFGSIRTVTIDNELWFVGKRCSSNSWICKTRKMP